MRIALIGSALILSAFVITKTYPKIASDLQWFAEDEVKQELEPILPPGLGGKLIKPGLAKDSLDGLKQATQKPKTMSTPPAALPDRKASREVKQVIAKAATQLPSPEESLRPAVISKMKDPEVVKKKDERWVSHLSGAQISVHSRSSDERAKPCRVDDDDCRREFDPNFSLVGVVVSTEKVRQGKGVDGRLMLGDTKDTPALYLQ